MARPVAGYLGYDSTSDRPLVKLAIGTKKLLVEGDAPTTVPAHASTHGSGGSDPITTLGNVTTTALRSQILSVAFASNITLDCNLANDFAISFLTGNTTITFSNAQLGNQGTIIVRQGSGNNTVSFAAPSPYVLTALTDLTANSAANAFTIYQWAFTGVSPTAILAITKVGAVPASSGASAPLSEFWAPPVVAHSNSDEFTGASLNTTRWRVYDTSDNLLTSAGNVDSTTSPAAGTVRITQANSRLYVQPALGTEVRIRQTISVSPASGGCQFSARLRMPVPTAIAAANDIWASLIFTTDPTGFFNCAEITWHAFGADNISWWARAISGGTPFGAIQGPNLDLTPIDAEFRILVTNTYARCFLFSGASKHYLVGQSMPNFTMPIAGYVVLRFLATNNAANNMPFAPIFDCDYVRQLDSPNVY